MSFVSVPIELIHEMVGYIGYYAYRPNLAVHGMCPNDADLANVLTYINDIAAVETARRLIEKTGNLCLLSFASKFEPMVQFVIDHVDDNWPGWALFHLNKSPSGTRAYFEHCKRCGSVPIINPNNNCDEAVIELIRRGGEDAKTMCYVNDNPIAVDYALSRIETLSRCRLAQSPSDILIDYVLKKGDVSPGIAKSHSHKAVCYLIDNVYRFNDSIMISLFCNTQSSRRYKHEPGDAQDESFVDFAVQMMKNEPSESSVKDICRCDHRDMVDLLEPYVSDMVDDDTEALLMNENPRIVDLVVGCRPCVFWENSVLGKNRALLKWYNDDDFEKAVIHASEP